MEMYIGSGLDNFDNEDIEGVVADVMSYISRHRESYSILKDLFRRVGNPNDAEEYEQLLADDALCAFGRALNLVLNSEQAYSALNKSEIRL